MTTHNLTNNQIASVRTLQQQGRYQEAWSMLAQWGDTYADDAAAVTGNPSISWIIKRAVENFVDEDEARHHLIHEDLMDVDAGRRTPHEDMQRWAALQLTNPSGIAKR